MNDCLAVEPHDAESCPNPCCAGLCCPEQCLCDCAEAR